MSDRSPGGPDHRAAITVCVILAALLQAIATLAMFPLLLVFRPPAADAASDHAMVLE
jgi:hypothetical protein